MHRAQDYCKFYRYGSAKSMRIRYEHATCQSSSRYLVCTKVPVHMNQKRSNQKGKIRGTMIDRPVGLPVGLNDGVSTPVPLLVPLKNALLERILIGVKQ